MQYFKNNYYHLYNRGNNKQLIFKTEENYHYLEKLIEINSKRFHIAVIAYCLMPNHYHFLLRQDRETQISRFIQSTFQSYTQAVNKVWERTGKLFENAVRAKLINEDSYLVHLCRYIHLNPVEAGLVANPANWLYSNYLQCIGEKESNIQAQDFFNNWFESGDEYREFVEQYAEEQKRYKNIERYIF